MGILDDAIREHLDLKRKHGARDADLREIEDEAFGSTDRPDPFSAGELFNEVSTGEAAPVDEVSLPDEPASAPNELGETDFADGLSDVDLGGGEDPTRIVEPEALRPSEPLADEPQPEIPSEPISPPAGLEQIPGQTELPGQDEIPGQERLDDPIDEFESDDEPVAEPPAPSESLEDLIAEEEPFPEDSAAPPPAPPQDAVEPTAPPEPVEPEVPEESHRPLTPEPDSPVPDPPPPPPVAGTEPPGRARGRVDVPTQEHPPPGQTGDLPPMTPGEPDRAEPQPPPIEEEPFAEGESVGDAGAPALYDFESDDDSTSESAGEAAPPDDDFEALGPAEEEAPYLEEEEPYAEEPISSPTPPVDEPGTEVRPALEDEEAYAGTADDPEESWEEEEAEEGLWFEKGPPKDFDFDD